MNKKLLLACAVFFSATAVNAAFAISTGEASGSEQYLLIDAKDVGKAGRIAVPTPRPDLRMPAPSQIVDTLGPIVRTRSGIRIVGVSFFPDNH